MSIEVCPNCNYKSLYVRKDGSKYCYKCGYEVDKNGNVVNEGDKSIKKISGKQNYEITYCAKCGYKKLYVGERRVKCYKCGFTMSREEYERNKDKLITKEAIVNLLYKNEFGDILTVTEFIDLANKLLKIGYLDDIKVELLKDGGIVRLYYYRNRKYYEVRIVMNSFEIKQKDNNRK